MLRKLLLFLLSSLLIQAVCAQNSLQNQIESITKKYNAKVGVAVRYDGKENISVNNAIRYPMLSTFKFPLALAVLDYLDKNQLPVTTEIYVAKSDLLTNTYSPLRDARPEGNFKISISELIKYSVSLSDNNACDILIQYLGGISKLQEYLNHIGITEIRTVVTEDQMHQERKKQYLNQAKPSAAIELIEKFLSKKLLSPSYQEFLEKVMIETTTGTDKLKGLLPSGTIVGHKTGSSDRDDSGLKIADNDLGFVLLPNGKHYSIAVFVMDSMEDDKTNASIIAQISKVVYDYYSKF